MSGLPNNAFLLCLALAVLPACTRTADKMAQSEPGVSVGNALPTPKKTEPEPLPAAVLPASLKMEETQMPTADYFRLIDSLHGLAHNTRDDGIGALARELYEAFYGNAGNFTQTTLMASPIPDAIAGEGEIPLREEALRLEAELNDGSAKLSALLKDSERTYPWPKQLGDPREAVVAIDTYTKWLLAQMPHLKMSPMFEVAVNSGIDTEYKKVRPSLVNLTDGIQRAKNLEQSLVVVKGALKHFNVKLKAPQAAKIRQAEGLVAQLRHVETNQEALGLVIYVWRISSTAEKKSFREVSPKLFDFLRSKSNEDLECLSKPRCPNPALGIAKLFIFKEIEGYGVRKLRAKVDDSARDSLKAAAKDAILAVLAQVPSIVKEKMDAASAQYFNLIATVKKDAAGFARSHLADWAKTNFRSPLRGIETSEIFVSIGGKGNIQVRPAASAGNLVRTGAETVGASLALAHKFLPEEDGPRQQAALLEPLLKLLGIGGFRQAGGKPFPSFLFALDGTPGDLFDLRWLVKGRTYFVPDSFTVSDKFVMDRSSAARSASVGAQAEMIRGIARQISFHRDWEQSVFDTSIGRFQLGELLPEAPGAINRPLFPKDLVFSLALANGAAVLQNVIRDLSPAIIFIDKGEVVWGNQFSKITESDKTSIVAAIVPIQDGQRSGLIQTREVARYLLAIDEFVGATDGLEQSQASVLQTKTDDGRSTLLQDLLDARKNLLLFQRGLTNFLQQVALQKDGLFHGAFVLNKRAEKVSAPLRLEDQALAIRALLASSSRLELPAVRQAALETFHKINQSFFDKSRQIYSSELTADGKPGRQAGLLELVLTLQAGEELSSHMASEARGQWEKLSARWLKALQDL